MTSKQQEIKGQIRSRPGTPTSRKEPEEMNMDTGEELNSTGLVECRICHKLFKKRGIKIHMTKIHLTKCGKMSTAPTDHRIYSKPEENQSQEPTHRGEVFQERGRVPFIVSQTFRKACHHFTHSELLHISKCLKNLHQNVKTLSSNSWLVKFGLFTV